MSLFISGTTSSSNIPLPPTLSVPQIFSYTSASSYPQTSSYVTVPGLPLPQHSTSSNYIPMFSVAPTTPPGFPFLASRSGLITQGLSFGSGLPQWSSYIPPITSYISGCPCPPYSYPISYRSHRLPSTATFTPSFHPNPSTTTSTYSHPVYYNTNYRPNLQ